MASVNSVLFQCLRNANDSAMPNALEIQIDTNRWSVIIVCMLSSLT